MDNNFLYFKGKPTSFLSIPDASKICVTSCASDSVKLFCSRCCEKLSSSESQSSWVVDAFFRRRTSACESRSWETATIACPDCRCPDRVTPTTASEWDSRWSRPYGELLLRCFYPVPKGQRFNAAHAVTNKEMLNAFKCSSLSKHQHRNDVRYRIFASFPKF